MEWKLGLTKAYLSCKNLLEIWVLSKPSELVKYSSKDFEFKFTFYIQVFFLHKCLTVPFDNFIFI